MSKNYLSQYSPSEQSLEIAFNLFFTTQGEVEYLELSSTQEDDYKGFSLCGKYNQEEELIRKDIFNHLSKEAKEVALTVINAPTEIIEVITTDALGMYSKKLLKKYFRKEKGWKKLKVEKVFKELTTYANNL